MTGVKMRLGGLRTCRHCQQSIQHVLLLDGERTWVTEGSVNNEYWAVTCTSNTIDTQPLHQPYDTPPVGGDLNAWLDA